MPNTQLKNSILEALDDGKGVDIQCLDVVDQTDIADFMIIVTGTSNRHVGSLTDRVLENARALQVRPLGVEGQEQGEWVLIDLVDVIVHVMLAGTREFYDLERLWSMTTNRNTDGTDGAELSGGE